MEYREHPIFCNSVTDDLSPLRLPWKVCDPIYNQIPLPLPSSLPPPFPPSSRNLGPFRTIKYDELAWWQKNLICWGRYNNINLAPSPAVQATAPVRPIRDISCVTGHVPVEMNQLHSGQLLSSFNIETSKLSVLCAKTHWRCILLLPSICKVNRNLFLMLIKHVCYSNKKNQS